MTGPLTTLLGSSFRSWLSAKGFWLVVIAALLPLVLTGAWVTSHRADIEVTDLRVEGEPLVEGETARFTATVKNVGATTVGSFNVSLAVGTVQVVGNEARLFPLENNATAIEGLAPGESRDITLEWNATSGIVFALATADPEDAVGEREELNNQKDKPLSVGFAPPTTPPAEPAGLAGAPDGVEVDLQVVGDVQRSATNVSNGDNATFTASFRNNGADVTGAVANVRIIQIFNGRPIVQKNESQTLDFAAGETKAVSLTWTAREGAYWVESYILPPAGAKEVTKEDNVREETLVVNPPSDFGEAPTPPDRPTIKQFYTLLLGSLYLRLVLPLIALFYAAGVIADERDQGALPYILTRPVPRWMIPLTKFLASFAVAAVAVIVGVVATYFLLFGTTSAGQDLGFLTTPLLGSLLTLFAYGALFTLMGTMFERPYLVGLGFVLGWETIATITGNTLGLASWVRNLTLTYHVQNAMAGWTLDQGLAWLPEGADALRGLQVALAAGAVALIAAAVYMKQREFDVG